MPKGKSVLHGIWRVHEITSILYTYCLSSFICHIYIYVVWGASGGSGDSTVWALLVLFLESFFFFFFLETQFKIQNNNQEIRRAVWSTPVSRREGRQKKA